MATVLVVEDDTNLVEIYSKNLKTVGYDVLTAVNGGEALELLAKEKPDLIITDTMMPRMSGFDMLTKIRQIPTFKDTPVIMMTALDQAEDKVQADKLGVVKYLVKSQVSTQDYINVAKSIVPPSAPSTKLQAAEAPAAPAAPAPSEGGLEPNKDLKIDSTAPSEPPAAETPASPAAAASTAEPPPEIAPLAEPDGPPKLEAAPATIPATEAPAQPELAPPVTPTNPPPAPAAEAPTPPPSNQPQSIAEEEAAIEAQINNFIDSNAIIGSSESAPTAPMNVAAPVTPIAAGQLSPSGMVVTSAPVAPAAAPTAEAPPAVATTQVPVPPQTAEPVPQAATPAPSPVPAASTAPAPVETPPAVETPAPQPAPQPEVQSTPKTVVNPPHLKVISPINDLNKTPDLNALVEKEVAEQNRMRAAQSLPTGAVINVENASGDVFEAPKDVQLKVEAPPPVQPPASGFITPDNAQPGQNIDPSSIAL